MKPALSCEVALRGYVQGYGSCCEAALPGLARVRVIVTYDVGSVTCPAYHSLVLVILWSSKTAAK